MPRLAPDFRRRLSLLGAAEGFAKRESNSQRLLLQSHAPDAVSQEVWVSPHDIFVAEEAPLSFGVSIWTYVVFPTLEATITEALRLAGVDPQLTDKRTVRFSLSSIAREGDQQCVPALPLDPASSPDTQAQYAWRFYWDRAAAHLRRLSSPQILSDLSYLPPFTSGVAWSTRQLLHHAQSGRFELCESIERGIEKTAAVELASPIKALMATAAERGHEFRPGAQSLDYRQHPLWLEFEAVRKYTARMA